MRGFKERVVEASTPGRVVPRRAWGTCIGAGFAMLVAGCATLGGFPPIASFAVPDAVIVPADNPMTAAKVELGRMLFFDTRLSGADDLSCASCHQPERGYEDGRAAAVGASGRIGQRNTPTLLNIGSARRLFWDGRVRSLEEQALMPVANPAEMNQDLAALPAELAADPRLVTAFAAAFPAEPAPSLVNVAKSLAAFQRTIRSGEAPVDRFIAGDSSALSPPAQRGFTVFGGKGRCALCHSGWAFTDGRLHDVGMPDRGDGRRFKTPTLRDIGRRAPYMHDGSLPTLESVVDHYQTGMARRLLIPPRTDLNPSEREDLLAFLRSLDSEPATPR